MSQADRHASVLLDEAVAALITDPRGCYVDATYGRGGHSQAILHALEQQGRLLVVDKDPSAIAHARATLAADARASVSHGSFAELGKLVAAAGWMGQVSGILLDLGVSSPQLDDPARGFSFQQEGPLDMRMDNSSGMSAADWVNNAAEVEIARVLKDYGEERYAKRMARALVAARTEQPILTTARLARIVAEANPAWEQGKHPATRAFQAIRILVNHELEDLQILLAQTPDLLATGGRLVVISFHSLEDRMVKRFIQAQERGPQLPRHLPILAAQIKPRMRRVGKARRAGDAEVAVNVRARSAVLRVAEKLV